VNKKFLLFVPFYNCEKQIAKLVNQLDNKVCETFDEVIFVNNRSIDNTQKILIECLRRKKMDISWKIFLNDSNYNLGGSHKVAFNYAIENKYDYIVVLHGDAQGSIGDFINNLNQLHDNVDCFLGSRFDSRSVRVGYSLFRTLGNYVFNFLCSLSLNKHITDMGSGLNCFKINFLAKNDFIKLPDDLVFNNMMLFFMDYKEANYKFFPIKWVEEDQVSNAKLFSQSYKILKMCIKYLFGFRKFILSDTSVKNKKYSYKIVESSS
tara:strand:+ start:979 stop:1770 length:792 start_codon:yes stop_codon:yes gene_type:complete